MPIRRSKLGPTVIREIIRKVYADRLQAQRNSHLPWHSRHEKAQSWFLLLFCIAWIVLILTAPFLLVILPFGLNYTVQWLIVGAWLLAASFVTLGLFSLTRWMVQILDGETPSIGSLLAGLALIIGTCGSLFLFYGAKNTALPSFVVLSVAFVVAGIGVSWGIYRLCVERETPLSRRIAFCVATVCWATNFLVLFAVLRPAYLDAAIRPDQPIQLLNYILSIVGWTAFLISQIKHSAAQPAQLQKQASRLFIAVCLVLIIVIIIMLLLIR